MHATLAAIESNDLGLPIAWAEHERAFLQERGSMLEYALHRSRFVQIALGIETRSFPGLENAGDSSAHYLGSANRPGAGLGLGAMMPVENEDPDGEHLDAMEQSTSDLAPERGMLDSVMFSRLLPRVPVPASGWSSTNVDRALAYARHHLARFSPAHLPEIQKLLTFLLFLPIVPIPGGLSLSPEDLVEFVPTPYAHFLDPARIHAPYLAPLFKLEYCVRHSIPKDPPLRIAVDLGAGGALSRILKVRAVMKESRSEWSQADELPVSARWKVARAFPLLVQPADIPRASHLIQLRSRSRSRRRCASTASSAAPSARSRAPTRTRP